MPEASLSFLIDQNVPFAVSEWLKEKHPDWIIQHVKDLGFEGKSDTFLYKWAQENRAIVLPMTRILQTPGCILWEHITV